MKNTEQQLKDLISAISGPDMDAMNAAEKRQAELAKPPGSLGKLEKLAIQLSGITGKVFNSLKKRRLLVFAADNGVEAEGVSSAPQSVTLTQAENISAYRSGAGVIAAHFGCEILVYDVGMARDSECGRIIRKKSAYSSGNIALGPAMSRRQAIYAILTGAEAAEKAFEEGVNVIGVGEMGIANTTTAAAVLAAITGARAESVTGRGGGITDEAYEKKLAVIEKAIEQNAPDTSDAVDVISKLGGFDIAAMCGAFLGAAKCRMPVVIDGFISAVAALCAVRLCPESLGFMIPSHRSFEIGYEKVCSELKLDPMLALDMRLGEGSGCPPAMEILETACRVMKDMASFAELGIDDDYLEDIRGGDSFTVVRGDVK